VKTNLSNGESSSGGGKGGDKDELHFDIMIECVLSRDLLVGKDARVLQEGVNSSPPTDEFI